MLQARHAAATAARAATLRAMGMEPRRMTRDKPKIFSEAQRAEVLQVDPALLSEAIVLSPRRMVNGDAHLTLFSAGLVETTYPAGTGQALFTSSMQGASYPGAQVAFPRIAPGKQHLVEFHVVLYGPTTFNFRVFDYPMGGYQDVSVPGGRGEVFTVLVPPLDEIEGYLELGAGLQQRDPAAEAAGWTLHSVRITTTN